ncbi:MAG TPA: hypothetical protein VGG71_11675 [Chitinophagaceae bacterium]
MRHKHFLGLFVFVAICSIASAQSLVLYTWDTYKMKFKISSDMTVNDNNTDKFEASNHNITMDIYPRKGENLTYSGMKNAVINWANQSNLSWNSTNSSGDEQPIYLKNLNGYWGCAIDGSKNGVAATMLLVVDPQYTEISFYIWISYVNGYDQDALQILKSFQPM